MTTREDERNRELCKVSVMVNSKRYLSVLEELRSFWQGDKMTLGNCIDFLQGVVAGQEDAALLGPLDSRQANLTQTMAEWEAEQARKGYWGPK